MYFVQQGKCFQQALSAMLAKNKRVGVSFRNLFGQPKNYFSANVGFPKPDGNTCLLRIQVHVCELNFTN